MLLIKNAHVIDAKTHTDAVLDILIERDRIIRMESCISLDSCKESEPTMIDALGNYVLPGLVDVHVHFRDPGFTYKEDIETGAEAAAKGGITSVVLMANTKPVVDNVETLKYVLSKGADTRIHVHTCAAITKDLKGGNLRICRCS